MDTTSLIIVLALATLAAGLAFGVWQLIAVRRSRKRGTQSALGHRPEDRPGH